eukprot:g3182.t1
MESYQEAIRAIEKERLNFLSKIDLVQPSFEEQHQLEWGRRYQDEELRSLRSELNEVSREVEAETKRLRDREEIIRSIRDEQQQDRVKIQTLLALSQPVTPDITVVFQALAPNACPPPPPLPATRVDSGARPGSKSSLSRNEVRERSSSLPPHAAAAGGTVAIGTSGTHQPVANPEDGGGGVVGAETAGDGRGTGARRTEEAEESSTRGGGGGEDGRVSGRSSSIGNEQRPSRDRRRRDADSLGGLGGGAEHDQLFSGEDDTDGDDGGGYSSDSLSRRREVAEPAGVSFGLHPGRRWTSEATSDRGEEGEEKNGSGAPASSSRYRIATARGGREAIGRVPPRRRRRRSREAGGGGGDRGGRRRDKDANRLRCTRGYQENLERRLELTQRHLRELGRLDRCYHETLERDRQEREVQVRVQKENSSLVAESLRRRTAEVDKRIAAATEDYLRLRHKAKEAHAVSAEEQRQCAEARRKSQAEVSRVRAVAEAEMEAIKREGRRRLDERTSGLRGKLVAAEEALQGERSHHAAIKQRYEERVARARDGVLLTRRRHQKLVQRRATEVVHLSDEMAALRRGVTELERRMFAVW